MKLMKKCHGHGTAMLWEMSPCCSSSQSVPFASRHVPGHHWTETGSVPFAPSPQVFTGLMRTPQGSSSEQSQLPCPLLLRDVLAPSSPLCPFSELSQVFPSLSYSEEPRTGHSPAGVASPVQHRGAGPLPQSAGSPLPSAAEVILSLLCFQDTPLTPVHPVSSRTPGPFLLRCFPCADLALVELHGAPFEVLLDGSTTLGPSSQFRLTCQH